MSELEPELVEQPVWGMDCYTRRNIALCLESEFDAETATAFVEKWLLPAIIDCPAELAHDISNAALACWKVCPFINKLTTLMKKVMQTKTRDSKNQHSKNGATLYWGMP